MAVPDNGPVIVGVTWWLCFFCGTFLALRIYAKLSRRMGLWWDDHILIGAWVIVLLLPFNTTQFDTSKGIAFSRIYNYTNGPKPWLW